jgi:hypothetical protein
MHWKCAEAIGFSLAHTRDIMNSLTSSSVSDVIYCLDDVIYCLDDDQPMNILLCWFTVLATTDDSMIIYAYPVVFHSH